MSVSNSTSSGVAMATTTGSAGIGVRLPEGREAWHGAARGPVTLWAGRRQIPDATGATGVRPAHPKICQVWRPPQCRRGGWSQSRSLRWLLLCSERLPVAHSDEAIQGASSRFQREQDETTRSWAYL